MYNKTKKRAVREQMRQWMSLNPGMRGICIRNYHAQEVLAGPYLREEFNDWDSREYWHMKKWVSVSKKDGRFGKEWKEPATPTVNPVKRDDR